MNETPPAQSVRPLLILVVENHPDTVKYLQMYLEQLGHDVHAMRNMHDALDAIPAGDYDVLISDIGLPDGDGWELLRKAKFRKPVYAIAMSGFGMGADHARSKAAGYRRHLLKPFGPDELDEMLVEAVEELGANA